MCKLASTEDVVEITVSVCCISLMKALIIVIPASRVMTVLLVYCFAREGKLQGLPLDISYLASSLWIRKPVCGFCEFLRLCFQHYIQKFQHEFGVPIERTMKQSGVKILFIT